MGARVRPRPARRCSQALFVLPHGRRCAALRTPRATPAKKMKGSTASMGEDTSSSSSSLQYSSSAGGHKRGGDDECVCVDWGRGETAEEGVGWGGKLGAGACQPQAAWMKEPA